MQLIPQWRKWYKRWSTWLLACIPTLTAAREFMPELKDLIDPDLYKATLVFLSIAVFFALQVKQNSVSGENGGKP